MKCFKITANEVENSVTIDGIVFSPQQCTAEEENIVLREMEKEWYIHSDYETTTEYCELSSSSSGSNMVYDLQAEDAVVYNNQVIGFVITGYRYDSQIQGKYFPIQDYENFNYKFESHRSYDHGDGDVDTTSYCSLRKKDPRKSVLMRDYCIQYEEDEKIHYKRITHDIVREDETGVSVNVDLKTWINYEDVGKRIKTEGLPRKTICFATIVKRSDLTEISELIDEYCIRWEKNSAVIEYKEILFDSFKKIGTVVEIDLGTWATDRLRFSEVGKKVRVGREYATLIKKADLSEFNVLMNEYCIRWEKDDTIEYEEILFGSLIKKDGFIGVRVGPWIIEVLLLCEAGKEVKVEGKKARATLIKKSDIMELN